MANETHKLRKFMREVLCISNGEQYADVKDESIRRDLINWFHQQAENVKKTSQGSPYLDLAHIFNNYAIQLSTPQIHFVTKLNTDSDRKNRIKYSIGFVNELTDEFTNFLNAIAPFINENYNNHRLLNPLFSIDDEHPETYTFRFLSENTNAILELIEQCPADSFDLKPEAFSTFIGAYASRGIVASSDAASSDAETTDSGTPPQKRPSRRLSPDDLESPIKKILSKYEFLQKLTPSTHEYLVLCFVKAHFTKSMFEQGILTSPHDEQKPSQAGLRSDSIAHKSSFSSQAEYKQAKMFTELAYHYYRAILELKLPQLPKSLKKTTTNKLLLIANHLLRDETFLESPRTGNKAEHLPYQKKRQLYDYYVGKCKFKTSTVIMNFITLFKLWHQLLEELKPSIAMQPAFVRYPSHIGLEHYSSSISETFIGVIQVVLRVPSDTLDVIKKMENTFKKAELSGLRISDTALQIIPHNLVATKEYFYLCNSLMKEFIFEEDHKHLNRIVKLAKKVLEHLERKDDNLLTGLQPSLHHYYYSLDNTIISRYQKFIFNLLKLSVPRQEEAQIKKLSTIQHHLSFQAKSQNLGFLLDHFEKRYDGLHNAKAKPHQYAKDPFNVALDEFIQSFNLTRQLPSRDMDCASCQKLLTNFAQALITKVITIDDILIKKYAPNQSNPLTSSRQSVDIVYNLFIAIPNSLPSKIFLAQYIYTHIHKYNQDERLNFLQAMFDYEKASGHSYELFPKIVLKLVALQVIEKPKDARDLEFSEKLTELIKSHNRIIKSLHSPSLWQRSVNHLYRLYNYTLNIMVETYASHRVIVRHMLAPSPIHDRFSSEMLDEITENQKEGHRNRKHSNLPIALPNAEDIMIKKHPLFSDILDKIYPIFLAQNLTEPSDQFSGALILPSVNGTYINAREYLNLHKSLQNLKVGLHHSITDRKSRSHITDFSLEQPDFNQLASDLSFFITKAISHFVRRHTIHLTQPSGAVISEKIFDNPDFQKACVIYLCEQLKYADSLDFNKIDFSESMSRLAEHICVKQYDFDHECKIFEDIKRVTGQDYSPRMKIKINSATAVKYGLIEKPNTHQTAQSPQENDAYSISLGRLIFLAWNDWSSIFSSTISPSSDAPAVSRKRPPKSPRTKAKTTRETGAAGEADESLTAIARRRRRSLASNGLTNVPAAKLASTRQSFDVLPPVSEAIESTEAHEKYEYDDNHQESTSHRGPSSS